MIRPIEYGIFCMRDYDALYNIILMDSMKSLLDKIFYIGLAICGYQEV